VLDDKQVHDVIESEINSILVRDDEPLPLDEDLFELGLNSLSLAQLLIQLEEEIGVDPFNDDFPVTNIRTVGDLITAYQRTAASKQA
jgi:acyl carrier protein